ADPLPAAPVGTPVAPPRPLALHLLKLARPHQWVKCGFVLIGPLYALVDGQVVDWVSVGVTAMMFALVASWAYVLNDIHDRLADAAHPRKRHRPIASGVVS